jgi:cysteine synthase A
MIVAKDILQAIGNTPIVQLRKIVPPNVAKIFVKLESSNPTGSMKDRMAQSMIKRAEEDGRLKPGGIVVEYTGGSTGTSLGLICAVKGYKLKIVTSDAFSAEKRAHMQALGAELTLVPSEGGRTTKKLIREMIEVAREISSEPNSYWTDQLNNYDHIAGYHSLGYEIWEQTEGQVDVFVQSVGTAASLLGTSEVLREKNPSLHVVAVEPAESAVLSGGETGSHNIEGTGIGYEPPLWDADRIDEIIPVSTVEAKAMARRLAREEALFAGTSSGANVVAALSVAKKLGPEVTIVTLMVDSGLKYLSTDVYQES